MAGSLELYNMREFLFCAIIGGWNMSFIKDL